MIKIAIFDSGNGSNVDKIFKYIKKRELDNNNRIDSMLIKMVFTNNKNAYVIKRCKNLNIPYFIFDKDEDKLLKKLLKNEIDFIVSNSDIRNIPYEVKSKYKNKIINIFPSLSKRYIHENSDNINVYKNIIEDKEKNSGITIHYVNDNDNINEKDIIYKVKQRIKQNDTPEILHNKIKNLEYKWYPVIIHSLSTKLNA